MKVNKKNPNLEVKSDILVPLNRPFTPIEQGIKVVGIGKKGSKKLPLPLIEKIIDEIKQKKYNPISLGALLAGLAFKGIENEEALILQSLKIPHPFALKDLLLAFPSQTIAKSISLKKIITKIIDKKNLSVNETYDLGIFLLTNSSGKEENENQNFFKGFAVSYLRVRYESKEEWLGLLQALISLTEKKNLSNYDKTILLFSEPFNGFKNQFFLSPILGNFFLGKNYLPFHLVGRNSGPKFIMNLLDLVEDFAYPFFTDQLTKAVTPWGFFLHQKHCTPALDNWVEKRWLTIKRPCWATLEKFITPFPKEKSILITSAFHPPYLEKMIQLGEDFGYQAVVVSKLGLEGGLFPSLKKPFKIMASKKKLGSYSRKKFVFTLENLSSQEKIEKSFLDTKFNISTTKNQAILTNYLSQKTTRNQELDLRIKLALYAYEQVLNWIKLAN